MLGRRRILPRTAAALSSEISLHPAPPLSLHCDASLSPHLSDLVRVIDVGQGNPHRLAWDNPHGHVLRHQRFLQWLTVATSSSTMLSPGYDTGDLGLGDGECHRQQVSQKLDHPLLSFSEDIRVRGVNGEHAERGDRGG